MFWQKQKKQQEQIFTENLINYKEPAKTSEYKTISSLLGDAERWRNVGDNELEKKTWQMIADKASMYSDGMRENYPLSDVKPDFLYDPYVVNQS